MSCYKKNRRAFQFFSHLGWFAGPDQLQSDLRGWQNEGFRQARTQHWRFNRLRLVRGLGGMSHLGGFLCWMIVDMNHVRAGQIVPQYSSENFDCAVFWCALNYINMVDISIYPHDYWLISQLFMVNRSMIPKNASMNSMVPQLFGVHYTASGHALLHPDDSWLSSW